MLIVQINSIEKETNTTYFHQFYLYNERLAKVRDLYSDKPDAIHASHHETDQRFLASHQRNLTKFRLELFK